MSKKGDNLKGMTESELKKKLGSLREEIRVIEFKTHGAKPKNVKETMLLRKKVARILTEMSKMNKSK